MALALPLSMAFALAAVWLKDAAPPETAEPPHLLEMLQANSGMLLLVLLLCFYRSAVSRMPVPGLLGLRRRRWRSDVLCGIAVGLAILVPTLLLSHLNTQFLFEVGFPAEPQQAITWLSDPDVSLSPRLAIVIHSLLFAPLQEEILYRGILLALALRSGRSARAVLLVALLFALAHLNLSVVLPLFFFGLVAAVLLLMRGGLAAPLAMHVTFNLANLLLLSLPASS